MRILLCITLLLSEAARAPALLDIRVPRTNPAIMIDGVLSKDEWQMAKVITIPDVANLYFQQSAADVYLAVEYTKAPSGMVDLYLSPSPGEIYNLHASAKLGERKLQSTGYPDWTWWNNLDWTANVSRVDSFESRSFLPTIVREFQIRRKRFPSRYWRLRVELTALTVTNDVDAVTVFPGGTSDRSTDGWMALDLK